MNIYPLHNTNSMDILLYYKNTYSFYKKQNILPNLIEETDFDLFPSHRNSKKPWHVEYLNARDTNLLQKKSSFMGPGQGFLSKESTRNARISAI